MYAAEFENYIQVSGSGYLPQKIVYFKDGKQRIIKRIYDAYIPINEKKELSVENICNYDTFNDLQQNPNSNFSLNIIVDP